MSVPTRNLSVIYGSLTCSASPYRLTEYSGIEVSGAVAVVRWTVIVTGTSDSNFQSNIETFETAMKTRFQRLQVVQGGQNLADFNPATYSGFNHLPEAVKPGGPPDSGRARRYECRVEVGLPADDNTGRRGSDVSIHTDITGRKQVIITGQYTASEDDTLTALANFEDKHAAYASGLLSSIGGTYHLTDMRPVHDDQNGLCDFTLVYDEIDTNRIKGYGVVREIVRPGGTELRISGRYIDEGATARSNYSSGFESYLSSVVGGFSGTFERTDLEAVEDDLSGALDFSAVYAEIIAPQSNSGTDHAAIVTPRVIFSRVRDVPGDAPLKQSVERLQRIVVRYTARLRSSETTDIGGIYESTIRPYILQRLKSLFGASKGAIILEQPELSQYDNTVSCNLSLYAKLGKTKIMQAVISQRWEIEDGKVITEVHGDDPYEAYVDQGPAIAIRTTLATVRTEGVDEFANIEGIFDDLLQVEDGVSGEDEPRQPDEADDGWVLIRTMRSPSPVKFGTKDLEDGITVTDTGYSVVQRFVRKPSEDATRGGGGSGKSAGGTSSAKGNPVTTPSS